jgi:drug/metabolite transporter (DMT)-like permease
VFIYKEPFVGLQKLGTSLILVGLLLFFNDRYDVLSSLDNQETIGVLIVVVAAITWTNYALLQKQLLVSFSSVQILFFIYVVSIFALLPFATPTLLWQLTPYQFGLLAFCCLNTIVAYGCFAEALNLWDASKVSAMLALAPLCTIGTLKLIVLFNPEYAFSDRLSWLSIVGALLLIVGSVLTALMPAIHQRRRRQQAAA